MRVVGAHLKYVGSKPSIDLVSTVQTSEVWTSDGELTPTRFKLTLNNLNPLVSSPDLIRCVYRFQYNARENGLVDIACIP